MSLIVTVKDSTTGAPIPNAEITGQYNTSPCAWDAWGCSSGDGQSIQGYTGSDGTFTWGVPYSCAGSFTNLVCQANGYNAQTYGTIAFGQGAAAPGNVTATFQMTASSLTTQAPPGQGLASVWQSWLASLGYQTGQSNSSILSAAQGASWELIALLIAVAIVIIAIVALLWSI